jgi:WD40 repeat protein
MGWIASASGDGTVVVADREGAVTATFEHATKKPGDAFSPDDPERAVTSVAWFGDDRFATAGNNGFVKVWNRDQLDPKAPKRTFHHGAPVRSLAWSPDGALVLSTAADGTAMLWQLADGVGRPLSGHRGPVVSGRFSSDGAQVVTASEDGTVRVWRTRDGRMIQIYDSLGAAVRDAAFAPGRCQRLVTASDDGTLRVWSMASGHELSRIAAHSGRPAGPLVFLDHGRVASGGVDGSVRVFPTCTATVVWALCEMRDRSAGGKPGPCPVTEKEDKACCSIKKEP